MKINWKRTAAKMYRAYRAHILHPELVRAEPLTLILLIISITGIYTTGANFTHDQAQVYTVDRGIKALQQAPDNLRARLTDAYNAGDINEAQYQVELERLDRLTPLFQQYAQRLDAAADVEFRESTIQALIEYLLAGAPFKKIGGRIDDPYVPRFEIKGMVIGGPHVGAVTDSAIGAYFTGKGITGLLERLTGSSDFDRFYDQLEIQMDAEIKQILSLRSSDLLKARLAHMINDLQNEWIDLQLQHPNDINRAYAEFRAYLTAKATRYADEEGLIDEFDTTEHFADWLSTLVDFDARPGDNISEPLLEANAEYIKRGECTTLRWVVPGDVYSIQLSGDGVEAQGIKEVCPTETTTYGLYVLDANGDEIAYRWVTVEVGFVAFSVEPDVVRTGESARLSWSVGGASEVALNGALVEASGTQDVTPDATTSYTLKVIDLNGKISETTVTVTVEAFSGFPPGTQFDAFSWFPASSAQSVCGQLAAAAGLSSWELEPRGSGNTFSCYLHGPDPVPDEQGNRASTSNPMPVIYVRIEVWLDDASLATWWATSEQTEQAANAADNGMIVVPADAQPEVRVAAEASGRYCLQASDRLTCREHLSPNPAYTYIITSSYDAESDSYINTLGYYDTFYQGEYRVYGNAYIGVHENDFMSGFGSAIEQIMAEAQTIVDERRAATAQLP